MTMDAGSPRRTRLVGLVLLMAAFVVGAIGGAAFERTLGAREPVPSAPCNNTMSNPLQRPPGTLAIDHIELTAEQRQRIDRILDRRRTETDSVWRAQKPRLRGIVDSTRAEIQALLTTEQRAEYDRLVAERRARHKKNCTTEKAG
jgi:Spy/CpxP family protein refolding chaperone